MPANSSSFRFAKYKHQDKQTNLTSVNSSGNMVRLISQKQSMKAFIDWVTHVPLRSQVDHFRRGVKTYDRGLITLTS